MKLHWWFIVTSENQWIRCLENPKKHRPYVWPSLTDLLQSYTWVFESVLSLNCALSLRSHIFIGYKFNDNVLCNSWRNHLSALCDYYWQKADRNAVIYYNGYRHPLPNYKKSDFVLHGNLCVKKKKTSLYLNCPHIYPSHTNHPWKLILGTCFLYSRRQRNLASTRLWVGCVSAWPLWFHHTHWSWHVSFQRKLPWLNSHWRNHREANHRLGAHNLAHTPCTSEGESFGKIGHDESPVLVHSVCFIVCQHLQMSSLQHTASISQKHYLTVCR